MPCRFFTVLLGLILATLAGCADRLAAPELGGIYNRAAQYHGPERNPVIVIPGILGSRLVDGASGKVVWGAFTGEAVNPNDPADLRLMALPMREGATLGELRDDVHADGALEQVDISLFFVPVTIRPYANILETLGAGGFQDRELGMSGAIDYGDDHYTCFQFAYDWRRDNIENAQRLHDFIEKTRVYVQKEIEERYGIADYDVRFDIVAHSMGGLLTRYYLRYGGADLPTDGSEPEITWAGAERVDRLVLVGTPNAGSAAALNELVHGYRPAPLLPHYPAAMLGTYPSIYQLLPRSRFDTLWVRYKEGGDHVLDVLDPGLWESAGWGLADPEQDAVLAKLLPDVESSSERRAIALDQQRKSLERARRFHGALDAPAAPPEGTSIHLFAGDAIGTPAVMIWNQGTGKLKYHHYTPGDGVVTRASALMDERLDGDWEPMLRSPVGYATTTFLFTDHLGLTRDPAFSDNVLYLLLEDPRD